MSFYNVARSLTIVFNVILSYWMLREQTSGRVLGTLGLVIAGFFLGTESEVRFSLSGTIFGIISSLFVSLNSILTRSALTAVDNDKWKCVTLRRA